MLLPEDMFPGLNGTNQKGANNSTSLRRGNRMGRPLVELRALAAQQRGDGTRERRVTGARAARVFHLDQARVDFIPQGNQVGIHVTSP